MKRKLPIARMSELIDQNKEFSTKVLVDSLKTISEESLDNIQHAFWEGAMQALKGIAEDKFPSFENYFKENYESNI